MMRQRERMLLDRTCLLEQFSIRQREQRESIVVRHAVTPLAVLKKLLRYSSTRVRVSRIVLRVLEPAAGTSSTSLAGAPTLDIHTSTGQWQWGVHVHVHARRSSHGSCSSPSRRCTPLEACRPTLGTL